MGGGNGVQALKHTFGAVQRHALDPAAAQLSGLVEGGVTLVNIGSHPLRFDAAHLGFAHTLFGDFGNLAAQSDFKLLWGFAFGGNRVEHEDLRATSTHGVRGTCAVGQSALALR